MRLAIIMCAEYIGVFPFVCLLDNGYNNTCAPKYRGFLSCASVTVAIDVSRNRGWSGSFRVPMEQCIYMCPAISGCFLSCAYGTVDIHVL